MADAKMKKVSFNRFRAKVFNMVSTGVIDEPLNRFYDVLSIVALILNLFAAFAITFDYMEEHYKGLLLVIEGVTTFFFAIDYLLRVFTAKELYPKLSESRSIFKYVLSFTGIIDLLSFLPYYLPVFFPAGSAVFRMFRVARILRLFRINSYYDQLNVITEVLASKKQQLLASVFIILILMMASSLCMYSVEHDAQPNVFQNAFSGVWWSVSTLLTVGYGDIYPVTVAGKILGILISFLGVGMVAIPTGIISAGFVEQYQKLKTVGDYAEEENIHFIRIKLTDKDSWTKKKIIDLQLPKDIMIVAVQRDKDTIIPRGQTVLESGDVVVMCAEKTKEIQPIDLKEITINDGHSWNGVAIKDLDISRQSYIFMIRRKGKAIIPRGNLTIKAGDVILLYEKHSIRDFA
ncbi:ion transport protein [Butyrivibrio proteoclasticus B316]|uniref:Ion transport protein n=1 Tax=Butyrivibrio proteoclasticus (strain ATCC 51982 / DSM 14932 / B316) TaxID=515622 RepID=E0S2Q8_BUTPB|nr:ion transporter [Butyrivibrio proteoclasticus]ADL34025.1 ion transport protein [Butyrivibrio proteoclasticus B316]